MGPKAWFQQGGLAGPHRAGEFEKSAWTRFTGNSTKGAPSLEGADAGSTTQRTKTRGGVRMTSRRPTTFEDALSNEERELLWQLIEALRSLRYGSLLLTVHDGQLVEIQKTEKIRPKPAPAPASKNSPSPAGGGSQGNG